MLRLRLVRVSNKGAVSEVATAAAAAAQMTSMAGWLAGIARGSRGQPPAASVVRSGPPWCLLRLGGRSPRSRQPRQRRPQTEFHSIVLCVISFSSKQRSSKLLGERRWLRPTGTEVPAVSGGTNAIHVDISLIVLTASLLLLELLEPPTGLGAGLTTVD